MIKMIVTDMDGTFLDDQKNVAEGTYSLLTKLKEMGIRFVVASGRQYDSLEKYFLEQLEDVVIVSENGGVIMENQEEVASYPMAQEDVKCFLDVVAETNCGGPVLCYRRKICTDNSLGANYFGLPKLQYEMDVVEDLYSHLEGVIKAHVIMDKGSDVYEWSEKLRNVFPESMHVAPSGSDIIDVGGVGVTKGMAVAQLQKKWGISPEETAVFGDQYNDVEMLDCGKYSYAMEGSEAGVQKHANFVGGDNNAGFVVKEICRLIGLSENGEKLE